MLKYNVQRAKKAVQILVDTSYFKHHVRKLHTSVTKPRALPFKDDIEPLNELLVIGRQSADALKNLIELAEFKRDSKKEVVNRYMADRRRREKKVIELEEFLVDKKLTLEERRVALQKQYNIWRVERDRHLERAAKEYVKATGQEPSWQDKNNFAEDFWILQEAQLDALLEEARKGLERPRHKKRVVKVEPKLRPGQNPLMMEKLRAAVRK